MPQFIMSGLNKVSQRSFLLIYQLEFFFSFVLDPISTSKRQLSLAETTWKSVQK